MKILKTGCGNTQESFIEDRLTDGVNVIFSNDNNKGKTIIIQGMMYALGNEPIFPGGFDHKSYYFYTSIEHNGNIFEFLRKNSTIAVKQGDTVTVFNDTSELKYLIESFNRFLIISLDVLICRYSPLFRAFPALFISEEPHKSFYYPLCFRSQK